MKTKDRLILEAFKLFCSKPYDQVTFSDLEKVTGLSRGAVLYHFSAKENIFFQVIDTYIFATHSIASIPTHERQNLFSFIISFIDKVKKEKQKMNELGLDNMNLALLTIEASAFTFYPDMQNKANDWLKKEENIWKEVIDNAIANQEIKNIDKDILSKLFQKIYLGCSYISATLPKGIDLDSLKDDFMFLYSAIKSN